MRSQVRIAFVLMVMAPVAAWGQSPPEMVSYPASIFAGAELATAMDMINRLPGFAFDDGKNARGFAGTAGNVLIDGARPTSKTDDLSAILQRIPASRVDQITVIRGSAPGIDMQGQSVVANLILKREDSSTLTVIAKNTYWGNGQWEPGGSIEFSRSAGAQTYQASVSRIGDISDDAIGDGHYTLAVPGQPATGGVTFERGGQRVGWGLNGSASLPLWGGTFGANLTMQQTFTGEPLTYGAPISAQYVDIEKAQPLEAGLNWDGQSGKSEITLLALERLERDQNFNSANDTSGSQIFSAVRDTDESILRGTWRYGWSDALTLESGGEAVYNSLNGRSSYLVNGASVALPAANARVNERRGEVFSQASWKFAANASLDAGARMEFSHISAQGVPSRSLSYLKPHVLLTWTPWEGHQIRLRAERVVGQIDFANFVASSNLSGNGVSAGNLGIAPDRRWQYQASYEYDFWGKGALVASILHEDISDLVDYVPIGSGLDGPGNVAKARNDEFKVDLSVPLDNLGIEGGLFKTSLQWDDSALRDPVTGQVRSISDKRDRDLRFFYTQDIAGWDSSITLAVLPDAWSQPTYRIAQVSSFRLTTVYAELDWDYKPEADLDFHVELDNFIPYHWQIEQDNYAGPRNIAPLTSVLLLNPTAVPRLFVQVRKTF